LPLPEILKHAAFSALARIDRPSVTPLRAINNFLLLQHASALGTVVHATPLIPALHAAVPHARIVVAASGSALEIFRGNPGVDTLLPIPDPTRHPLAAARALRKTLAFDQPFATITTSGNERSGIALAAWLIGAENLAGFTLAPEIYRVPLTFDPAVSKIANNLSLIEALGHPAAQPFEPQVFFSDAELEHVRALLRKVNPANAPIAAFVMQGSGGQRTSWHDDRFAEVIGHVVALGCLPLFVGTAADAAAIERIQALAHGVGNSFAGRTSITQLAALFCLCDLVVSVDTGAMHVARASGTPMVVLGPSWQKPIEWLPLNIANIHILRGADRMDVPPNYCLDEIEVAEVIVAIDTLRQAFPQTTSDREQRVSKRLSAIRPSG
jgi:ADP-heptose:LPS heptosyltransferase